MPQHDTTNYPLTLSELQPNRKIIDDMGYDELCKTLYSYKKIRSLGLGGARLNTHRAMISIAFPATLDGDTFIASLKELHPYIVSERGQILDHDHEKCPIDHLYLSRHGDVDFSPEMCVGAAIFHSEGSPNGLLLNDIPLVGAHHGLNLSLDDVVEMNRSLYEDVFRPLAKRHGGTFVLTSDN